MNKLFNKALMVALAVIITLSSAPVSSIAQTFFDSPVCVVAQAATAKTHLNRTKKSIYIGKKYTLKLISKTGKTIPSSKIKWSRSNKTVASVSEKGVVTGKKAGKIKITATYNGNKYTAVITVKSAVSANKTELTINRGSTAKRTIKITCKDNEGIRWKTVEGTGIVTLSQAKKWVDDTKSFYITPTGKKFGKVKIKIYSVENSNSYVYVYVDVKKPYALKVKNQLPCTINNYTSQTNYENGVKKSTLRISKATYKTPNVKTLDVSVYLEARKSVKVEDYYRIRYRLLDSEGYLVKSGTIKSPLMEVGDKAKVDLRLSNLKNGTYTIQFRDYITPNSDTGTITPDTNKPTDSTSKPSATLTNTEALAMYQKAAKEINQRGIAGYTKKAWQSLEDLALSNNASFAETVTSLIESFMTTEEDAEEKVNAKGSDDAMNRMPISDCSMSTISSITSKLDGDYYTIKIVMKDHVNPSYDDSDGLARMSKDFLDIKDVKATVETDEAVSKIVSNFDGTINYKAYTIEAKMTKDGKLVEINHYGTGYINADFKMIFSGNTNATGAISFNARYYDFKY